MNNLSKILFSRKHKVMYNRPQIKQETETITRYVLTSMKNLEAYGFTYSKELFEVLTSDSVENIITFHNDLIAEIKELIGADVEYKPMYPNFPTQVIEMDDIEFYVNALFHYWSDGQWLPEYKKDERFPLIDSVKLKPIKLGTIEDLIQIRDNLITAPTSISEQDKADLITLFDDSRIRFKHMPTEIPFKENIALIGAYLLQNKSQIVSNSFLALYCKTATDVLRLAVALSDGDLSLSENTKFISFPRRIRRLLLSLLDNDCGNIEEDMKRHTMAWIRLGERLHPSEYNYEKVNMAFDKLRNNGHIDTFNGKVELAIKNGNLTQIVKLLSTRGGEFARRLDHLLRICKTPIYSELIIEKFEKVANTVSTPVLLQLRNHFLNQNDNDRIFFIKGNTQKVWVNTDENKGKIDPLIANEVVKVCNNALREQYSKREPMGNVYIDQSMQNIVIPFSQRSASGGMNFMTRGSRFSLDKDYVRLFIHWCNEIDSYGNEDYTDIDLSATFLNEKYERVGQVSYYSYRTPYSVHSGDITNAPISKGGACEFVDIDVNKALKCGVRYISCCVFGYTDSPFNKLDSMYFGWMEREDLKSGEVFEPSTVKHKINLSNPTRCAIPCFFDLKERKVIWADLALNNSPNYVVNTEGNLKGITLTTKGIIEMKKPSIWEVAWMNVDARGYITSNRNEADIIFDMDETKPVEKVKVVIKDNNGNIIEEKYEEQVRDNVKIITPYDVDELYSLV